MRIRKLSALAALSAVSLAVGAGVGHAATPTRTAAVKPAVSPAAESAPVFHPEDFPSVVLPNCEDIEPVWDGGAFTGSCLMWDMDSWQLRIVDVDSISDGVPYPQCATEDSTSCVWDSYNQGNHIGPGLILNP